MCNNDEAEDKPLNPFEIPTKKISKIIWAVFFPINLLLFCTVPDCRRETFKKFPLYFLTFLISAVYFALFSYILVWMAVIISFTIDIPDSVAGLTVLAAGTSIPEIVSGKLFFKLN